MRLHLITALMLGLLAVPLSSGIESQWQELSKIQRDDRIQVVDQKLRSYTGRFISFSDEGITLLADKEMTIAKPDVYRVTVISRGRGRHVLRGLLFGTGIGLGIGAAASAPHSVEGHRGEVIATSALLGAGIGALVGVVKQPEIPIYRTARVKK
jgi:hypothetical protein